MHQNALKPLLKLTMKMFVVPEQEEEDFSIWFFYEESLREFKCSSFHGSAQHYSTTWFRVNY